MIGVLIMEDMEVIRAGLAALLDGELGIEVTARTGGWAEALDAVDRAAPDVALLGIEAAGGAGPGGDDFALAREFAVRAPVCRTIVLTSLDRPGQARRALAAGASGYVLKNVSGPALARAVRTVASGVPVVEPRRLADTAACASPLTHREAEALRLASAGAPAQEIAGELFLGIGTVRNRLSAATGKLHARGLVDAIRIAERHGWI